MSILIEQLLLQIAVDVFIIVYVGFFALHAVQHVADPVQRVGWLLLIVAFNIFGTTLYFFTKYRQFRAIGKGGFIVAERWTWALPKDCFYLSEAEKFKVHEMR